MIFLDLHKAKGKRWTIYEGDQSNEISWCPHHNYSFQSMGRTKTNVKQYPPISTSCNCWLRIEPISWSHKFIHNKEIIQLTPTKIANFMLVKGCKENYTWLDLNCRNIHILIFLTLQPENPTNSQRHVVWQIKLITQKGQRIFH